MTQDQIALLAEEYAWHKLPNPLTYDDEMLFVEYLRKAKSILEWLLRDRFIVSRNRVMRIYDIISEFEEDSNNSLRITSNTRINLLIALFGEETFNPAEK